MTELERMLAGLIYDPNVSELLALRAKAHSLCRKYNSLDETDEERNKILKELLPNAGELSYLQGPIQFDYGINTYIGKMFYANFNFTVLDCAKVIIGDDVFIGPNVSLLTPLHPLLAEERNAYLGQNGIYTDKEYAKPIIIKGNNWIAGNVTITGGVTIHKGAVIGAGAVVVSDIPENALAVGVPAKPIRYLTEKDKLAPELLRR